MFIKPYIFLFQYKNYNIKLVSTIHNKRDLNIDEIKSLIDDSEKRKTCYLLETDFRKKKNELRKPFGDFTSKIFVREIVKIEKNTNMKKCIKGWDVRQSILTQKNQDFLYYNFFNLPYGAIENFYLKQLKYKNLNDKNIEKNIQIFLNHNYNQMINHFNQLIKIELNKIQNTIKQKSNDLNNILIKDIIEKNNVSNNFNMIKKLLMEMYAIYSDLFTLENIFKKNIDKDYIIFVGSFHFNNLINLINHMKKDNLF